MIPGWLRRWVLIRFYRFYVTTVATPPAMRARAAAELLELEAKGRR